MRESHPKCMRLGRYLGRYDRGRVLTNFAESTVLARHAYSQIDYGKVVSAIFQLSNFLGQ